MSKCVFPKCDKPAEHRHHVVYKPKPSLRGLCREHHEDITIINTNQAWKIHRKLSNSHRWIIWEKWLKGELTPQRTPEALAWIAKWRKPRIKKVKVVADWSSRSNRMTEEMFDTGLTHGEARRITDNARKHMRMSLDEADSFAVCILSDANFASGLEGEMAKSCEKNLTEAWPLWSLGHVRHWMELGHTTGREAMEI